MVLTPQEFRLLTLGYASERTLATYTAPETRLLLFALALGRKNVLELGGFYGGTTKLLVAAAEAVTVVDIDPRCTEYLSERFADDEVAVFEVDAGQFLEICDDEEFDLIFVDANHDVAGVLQQAREFRRVLSPGGIGVFHDVRHPEYHLGEIVEVFPDWERLTLPSLGPKGEDFGVLIVRKPDGLAD